jgi:tetratricopeptide (TPR) repeat protein
LISEEEMKKNIFNKSVPLLLLISLVFIFFSELPAQRDELELGIRFIKLGNSYRESGNMDKALEYLEKGSGLVNKKSDYWSAVSKEYYGYLFRDIARKKKNPEESRLFYKNAMDSFNEALVAYKRIIRQTDGSPGPLEAIMQSISELEEEMDVLKNTFDGSPVSGDAYTLNLDRQKLKVLPGTIPANIKNLSLSMNRFSDFPSGLGNMTALEHLNLSKNRIKTLPSNIGSIKKLHWLDLSNNRIKSIPNEIGNLTNLTELNLENNRLKELPSGLCNLKNLRVLNLRKNKLPYEQLSNIIKCLPGTNVLFDEYILKPESVPAEPTAGEGMK